MFFILSKTLDLLLLPYTWIVIAAFCSVFLKDKRKKRIAGIVLLLLLLIPSNTFIVNYLFSKWEPAPKALKDIPDQSTAIVLTGITKLNKLPHDRVHFQRGADRITQTVMLYRLGKIKNILITGGSGKLFAEQRDEASELKKFLLDCQIPDSIIFIEDQAKNTRENALLSKVLLEEKQLAPPYVLITSAFHMRRTIGCFQKTGMTCIPYPVDYYSFDEINNPIHHFSPEAGTLHSFNTLFREWCGYVIYKVMGYV